LNFVELGFSDCGAGLAAIGEDKQEWIGTEGRGGSSIDHLFAFPVGPLLLASLYVFLLLLLITAEMVSGKGKAVIAITIVRVIVGSE